MWSDWLHHTSVYIVCMIIHLCILYAWSYICVYCMHDHTSVYIVCMIIHLIENNALAILVTHHTNFKSSTMHVHVSPTMWKIIHPKKAEPFPNKSSLMLAQYDRDQYTAVTTHEYSGHNLLIRFLLDLICRLIWVRRYIGNESDTNILETRLIQEVKNGEYSCCGTASSYLSCDPTDPMCLQCALGLTALLSNNTPSMIYSPMNTKWPWFDLSMPLQVKCHDVNWKTIYLIWFTMCSWKIVYDAPFRRCNLFKSCDLDSTLKVYPMSNVLR